MPPVPVHIRRQRLVVLASFGLTAFGIAGLVLLAVLF